MNQVVVITGLAQGMGREVAKLLAQSGDTIAGFDMNEQDLLDLKKELDAIGGDHLLEPLNILDRKKILGFRDRVLEKYGRVDTVLSNIGIGFFGPFEETDLESAFKCIEINILGTAAVFQAFLPAMREKRQGKLVAMSSLVGRIPFPFESIYTATKYAIEGMVQAIRYEVKPFGIKMAIIEPAQVSTKFASKIHHLPPQGSPYRDRAKRFIDRDNELIKDATTPMAAAKKIFAVLKTENPKFHNQVDFMSSFFLFLNKILPTPVRDYILLNHMNIK
ncbi:MAG: SDR family NAD(P)-dependent oxidoreductase [Proteobacteria bacterium]|nr:SDR family NAD(P)-dependent oxidoreductase [Desulfobacula sp.]MBU3953574.1 SDR family NAD(P)-dependent oxidoreductase [Pseudomonadota bacterium]MBU4129883.1 SDR family NAD(P)-dependent oxidoreductase [Pseudomonadota bacterium]